MAFTLYRDDWGVPHLWSDDPIELSLAQGWEAAADRGIQIESERRRAEGRSAAVRGRTDLDWDRFARQARIDDTGYRAYQCLDRDTATWVHAYTEGINLYLATHDTGVAAWNPWTPLSIWLSHHILFGSGFPAKLWRDRVATVLGEEAVDLFATDGPNSAGSNGWLIPGHRTAHGHPILAGDPHRIIERPGLYQQIRLACPDFDVLGFAVPGVPGIPHFGHTGTAAWGITNAMADSQDLFWEQLRFHHDGHVTALGPDGDEPVHVHQETIKVSDGTSETVTVMETERGPVIAGNNDTGWLSLRCPSRSEKDLGFAALPELLRANTIADIDNAVDHWVLPVNVVMAADARGGHLHRVAGRVPSRDRADAIRPRSARNRRYRWPDGMAKLPRHNITDMAVMANDSDLVGHLGIEFAPPHRANRIRTLLNTAEKWTSDDMERVFTDTLLPSAEPLVRAVSRQNSLTPAASRLQHRLSQWDRRMEAGSMEATWFARLRSQVVAAIADVPNFSALADDPNTSGVFQAWLSLRPRIAFTLEYLLSRDNLLLAHDQVEAIVADALERTAAENETVPPWGSVHTVSVWQSEMGREDRLEIGGDHDCVLSTTSVPGVTDGCVRGPAARWVWDLSSRDRSRWIVPFGASGVVGNPHESDQLPLWQQGCLIRVVTDWQELHKEFTMTETQTLTMRRATFTHRIPDFGTVRLVEVNPDADIDLIHRWVHEPRARFWGMNDLDKEQVRDIYRYLDSLSTHHVYLVVRGDSPVALFQTYQPDADPVGECYDVQPGDIGAHLLVSPISDGTLVADFTAQLMRVFAKFLFADPTRQRVVVEPDARNDKALKRLRRAGFALGPEVDLPDKRARLAFLDRRTAESL